MNFKWATTHVLILSVIQRGALQTDCIQHWGCNGKILQKKFIVKTATNLEYMYIMNSYLEEERETLLGVIEWVVTNQPKHVDEG